MTPLEQARLRAETLKAGFFDASNRITLSNINTDHPVAQCAVLWLRQLDWPNDKGVLPTTILPRKRAGDPLTQWYGVAFSLAQSRDFREQLTAFVGPTLSNYRGHTYTLDPTDASENALIEATGLPQIPAHFSALDKESGRELVQALELMARVRGSSEVRQVEQVTSTGRVLRRFELALRAGRRDEAESHLAYLRRHHRLDRLNLQFLEVQLRAELGLWSEIVGLPHFNDLAQVRRPVAVTDALLHALFEEFLSPAEEEEDVAALKQRFEDDIVPRSGTLFNIVAGLHSPVALKTVLLWAVLRDEDATGRTVWARLQAATPSLSAKELEFWTRIAGELPPLLVAAPVTSSTEVVAADPLVQAGAAFFEFRYEDAWELLLPLPSSSQRAGMLLQCAGAIGTLDTRGGATEAVLELPPDEREALISNPLLARVWNEWQREETGGTSSTAVAVPRNWLEWLTLVEDDRCGFTRLHDFASQGAREWDVSALLDDVGACEELERRLESLAGRNDLIHDRLFAGIPSLLGFLERDEAFPRPSLKPLFSRLRSILALYGETSDLSQWLVYADLCRVALDLGLNAQAYKELVDETELLWTGRIALSNFEAALEVLDILWIHSCHNEEGRASLANRVFSWAHSPMESGRLDSELERICRQLARDYRLEKLLPSVAVQTQGEEASDPLLFLSGKTVAIYSLMESTIQRVKELILARCPECQVELNHDKAASTALSNLARTADVFVAVAGSAKHAATNAITAARPQDKDTILVTSKGSSALLRALSSFASGLRDTEKE